MWQGQEKGVSVKLKMIQSCSVMGKTEWQRETVKRRRLLVSKKKKKKI